MSIGVAILCWTGLSKVSLIALQSRITPTRETASESSRTVLHKALATSKIVETVKYMSLGIPGSRNFCIVWNIDSLMYFSGEIHILILSDLSPVSKTFISIVVLSSKGCNSGKQAISCWRTSLEW